jgi:hypothetical protein
VSAVLQVLQSVALWLVCKTADRRSQLVLPLSLFGLHLFLGNWWNGEACGIGRPWLLAEGFCGSS